MSIMIVTLYIVDNRVISTSPNAAAYINTEVGIALQRLGARGFEIKSAPDNGHYIVLQCPAVKVNRDNLENLGLQLSEDK